MFRKNRLPLQPTVPATLLVARLANQGGSFISENYVLHKAGPNIKTPVRKKIIVYTGDFENDAGDIKLINYRHLQKHLP